MKLCPWTWYSEESLYFISFYEHEGYIYKINVFVLHKDFPFISSSRKWDVSLKMILLLIPTLLLVCLEASLNLSCFIFTSISRSVVIDLTFFWLFTIISFFFLSLSFYDWLWGGRKWWYWMMTYSGIYIIFCFLMRFLQGHEKV